MKKLENVGAVRMKNENEGLSPKWDWNELSIRMKNASEQKFALKYRMNHGGPWTPGLPQ